MSSNTPKAELVHQHLTREMELLIEFEQLETGKRSAIIKMNALELKEISAREEETQMRMDEMLTQRQDLWQGIDPHTEPRFSVILEWLQSDPGDKAASNCRLLVEAYRLKVEQVQQLVQSNQKLLQDTTASIQRLLSATGETLNQEMRVGYTPTQNRRITTAQATLFVNANA
ncbi:MAG: flagellar export chaperone FlgN [Leptospiraceae bacterium]|nr:flagellar export chaperone FlgN [Leptospiraceae bacterium]